jgi:hypothetical protein
MEGYMANGTVNRIWVGVSIAALLALTGCSSGDPEQTAQATSEEPEVQQDPPQD